MRDGASPCLSYYEYKNGSVFMGTSLADVTLYLGQGFLTSLKLFSLTLVMALPLGLLFSVLSMSKVKIVKAVMKVIIWAIRGTPLMLQIFVVFYGPGLMGWHTPEGYRFNAALIAFVINYACYFSEIYRGGIESIPRGQYEAGQVLGMTKKQIFFKVVLLQVIKRIVPPMSNEIITLVKDTSLANTIGIAEIIFNGRKYSKMAGLVWPLFFTGVFYLVFVGILTLIFNYLEKKLSYFEV